MKIMLAGSAPGVSNELIRKLERLGHVTLNPAMDAIDQCDMFVAFVDDLQGKVLHRIQDAIESDKPVLCLTNGHRQINNNFLVKAGQQKQLELVAFSDVDEALGKVISYHAMTMQHKRPQQLHS